MPDSCVEEIIEADAVIKGQTVSSSFKPAILKNGVKSYGSWYILKLAQK